jgi:predicted component of type VI protein secretion system
MLRLTKPTNTVGRSETSDVLLPHESVSEQHAEIRFDGKNWWFVDSGSSDGSVVDAEHLHSNQKVLRRNTLIIIGALHLIFLNNSKRLTARDRREDERALQLLSQNGSIDKYTATEVLQIARADTTHSIAEIVLQDTRIAVPDWANAVVVGRRRSSLFWRILRLFTGGRL